MIHSLRLIDFKNFQNAQLELGRFTLLVGTNASGKSNIRDAFRFLYGMGQGYSLAEILGEKYIEGGALQWKGIRGGISEIVRHGEKTFTLESHLGLKTHKFLHRIEVALPKNGPRIAAESLRHNEKPIYSTSSAKGSNGQLLVQPDSYPTDWLRCDSQQPVLTQFVEHLPVPDQREYLRQPVLKSIADLKSIRFLDFEPEAMRRASNPGQTILGDRGENLSSVLQAMCQQAQTYRALIEWVKQLAPMDLSDFEFVSDASGKVLVTLIESNGERTTANSASDGTLRFLGMLAAFLGPKRERLIFTEEIETGIHPTRLHLLVELIEHAAESQKLQIVGTTHSPYLLAMLSSRARDHAHLVYRLEGTHEGRVRRIIEIPEAQNVLKTNNLARLHETGWLEDAVFFAESAGTSL